MNADVGKGLRFVAKDATSDLKHLISVDDYRSLQEMVESGDQTRHVEIEVPSFAWLEAFSWQYIGTVVVLSWTTSSIVCAGAIVQRGAYCDPPRHQEPVFTS